MYLYMITILGLIINIGFQGILSTPTSENKARVLYSFDTLSFIR
jgi:hypothetical protein